ncbi:MAG TPA: rhodanese-like domain-containing protein [Rhodothermales bacterium]|nr:rhodanese-like domain-containing protein [Rhodothermales bacterium]HRR10228.1 rhodanese-like domain-containing protein [Rhodothermales bacterium]
MKKPNLLCTLVCLALVATTGCAPKAFISPTNQISVTEAHRLIGKKTVFVDVREHNEVTEQAYDIPGVIHIPLSVFESRYSELPKDKQLVVMCRSGRRSLQAYNLLKEKGYTNMTNMEGGMLQWQAKGFPVVKGQK